MCICCHFMMINRYSQLKSEYIMITRINRKMRERERYIYILYIFVNGSFNIGIFLKPLSQFSWFPAPRRAPFLRWQERHLVTVVVNGTRSYLVLYIYIYTCIFTIEVHLSYYIQICFFIYKCVYIYIWIFMILSVYVYVYIYTCFIYTYTNVYIYIHIYMYTYIYIYKCTYTMYTWYDSCKYRSAECSTWTAISWFASVWSWQGAATLTMPQPEAAWWICGTKFLFRLTWVWWGIGDYMYYLFI